MKRHSTTTLAAVLFILLTAASVSAQSGAPRVEPPPPPPPRPISVPAQLSIDPGRLEGNTYSNDFFGISFIVPEGWVAQDAEAKRQVAERGRAIISEGATQQKKAATDAAMNRTYLLLSTSKYDPTQPRPGFNALLMFVVERVPTAIIKNEADYITLALNTLKGTSATAKLLEPVRAERVGGQTFMVASIKMSLGNGATAVQKYYVKLTKGYALTFIYTYVDEPDLKFFEDTLKTVKFK